MYPCLEHLCVAYLKRCYRHIDSLCYLASNMHVFRRETLHYVAPYLYIVGRIRFLHTKYVLVNALVFYIIWTTFKIKFCRRMDEPRRFFPCFKSAKFRRQKWIVLKARSDTTINLSPWQLRTLAFVPLSFNVCDSSSISLKVNISNA